MSLTKFLAIVTKIFISGGLAFFQGLILLNLEKSKFRFFFSYYFFFFLKEEGEEKDRKKLTGPKKT